MVKDLFTLSAQYIKGVGPKRAALLEKLGIVSARDILYYLPFRYEDRRNFKKIRDLEIYPPARGQSGLFPGPYKSFPQLQTVSGRVIAKSVLKLRGKRTIFELVITDGSGTLNAKWFNQPFMENRFETGDEVVLSGIVKPSYNGGAMEMENPEYEVLSGLATPSVRGASPSVEDSGQGPKPEGGRAPLIHTGRIVPVYRATGSLSSRQIRAIVHEVIESHLGDVTDPVLAEILERVGLPGGLKPLPGLRDALRECHFPDEIKDNSGRNRLAFDELFLLELGICLIKKSRIRQKGISHQADGALLKKLRLRLPFRLTPAQDNALSEILEDMKSPYPMNRLLQ